ncbi:tetratricopeptide repeat protein, partial [Candidatus Microgenomates bacterium]|nr:tetratricopeptide repeat protein [Candidatus Microgenomates bacterium]
FVVALALYTLTLAKIAPKMVFDTKISVINLQEGLSLSTNVLSIMLIALSLILAGVGGFFGARFLTADLKFQQSLFRAAENKGVETYDLQRDAITLSPYRDGFRRVFSQTNLALANAMAQNLRTNNASPSAQQQQTMLQLVQQSINNAQAATNLGPQNFLNWDNLGAIYRTLVGFGQNAENFAVTSLGQAVTLYPTNPQLRLSLGGVYYQLGQWDQAQRQFELAVQLKPDLANAYYNLGHALENKGELGRALAQYQAAEALLAQTEKDSDNYRRILAEIEALKNRISREGATVAAVSLPPPAGGPAQQATQTQQEPLRVSTPATTLPQQQQKVEIPPPTEATKSAQ